MNIQPYLPIVQEGLRFVLLISAAVFSFLSWRWYKMDNRVERENLLRSRHTKAGLVRAVGSYEIRAFKVRVSEKSGKIYFLKKIWNESFEGETKITYSTTHENPRVGKTPIPDIENITSHEEFKQISDQDSINTHDNVFEIVYNTADPDEIDNKYNQLSKIIEDVCIDDQ